LKIKSALRVGGMDKALRNLCDDADAAAQ